MPPASAPLPVVLHVPHASVEIPADVRQTLAISDKELERELLRMTDRYTDELFAVPGATSVLFPVSRLVVDPERFPEDADEPMSRGGMGAVYTRTSDGDALRGDLTVEERAALLERFYHPHHARLADAVAAALERRGGCLILDCHSFSPVPLPHEPDQDPNRPEICIGTDAYHTPPWLLKRATAAFEARGWRVEVDRPFPGALVPLRYYECDARVLSIMVEVNRGLYMEPGTGRRLAGFERLRERLQEAVREIVGAEGPEASPED